MVQKIVDEFKAVVVEKMIKSENMRLCQSELIYRCRFADVSRPKGPTYKLLLHVGLRGREKECYITIQYLLKNSGSSRKGRV